jgi:hypothetical protein
VTAVFSNRSRRGRVDLVMTTASRHGNRRVTPGSSAGTFAGAYPNRRRLAPGLFRASPHSELLFGIRRGRVAFVAVAGERVLAGPRRLARALRLATH